MTNTNFSPNVRFFNLNEYWRGGLANLDRTVKISKYFTIGELIDASKFMENEDANIIPLHKNIPKASDLVREATGKPVYWGSAYRTFRWEIFKERSGNSSHVEALAIDLNGEDVFKLIWEAYHTKNTLYHKLRALGVTSYGFYDWGVHIDFRKRETDGRDRFWDYREKKKDSLNVLSFAWVIPAYFLGKKLFKYLKKKRII